MRPLLAAALCGALAVVCPGAAACGSLDRLDTDAASGALSIDQYFLYRFHAGFAPERLPPRYRADGDDVPGQGRCGTPLIIEYLSRRDELSPQTSAAIDAYLSFTTAGDTLLSAGGHFRLTWIEEGTDAVPLADDNPADGVPDFVAHIAEYLETAWAVEVDELGLRSPPSGQPVDVSFRRMHFYGYTLVVNPQIGATRLVLHSSFAHFPPNDDPDGSVAGCAKVTAAHEFRHACQFAGSRWSEYGWVELDATWAEERVFDQVNDYRHYLMGDSPVRRPGVSLDSGQGGTGSYDDAVFQIWLNRRWGDDLIRAYWERRAGAFEEAPLDTWDAVLAPHDASLASVWGDFIGWNFATGNRASVGVGYPDAASYPAGDPAAVISAYPGRATGKVEHLAAAPVLLTGFDALGDRLVALTFDGDDGPDPMALALHVRTTEGDTWLESVGLDRQNDARITLPVHAGQLSAVGVIVGNGLASGPARFWTLAVDTVPGPPPEPSARLRGIEPNPCNPTTWVTCEFSERADATLDVVDTAGRRVRRLWSGSLDTGHHRFHWDGRTDAGQPAPAGVYVARLASGRSWQGRKLTLVR